MNAFTSLDLQAILTCLPHRYPFLLVDKVVNILPNTSIVALKNVTINEPFFQGHFPNQPVMPGVLILEAMAQAAGILGICSKQSDTLSNQSLYLLAGIEHAKFKAPVVPGDQLQLEARVIWARSSFLKCHVQATVEGKTVCQADITGHYQINTDQTV